MPRCWYVLMRFWLRVDNVLVRMRDTRMMCTFGSRQPQVHRELKWSEGTFADLRRESAPANQASRASNAVNSVILPVAARHFLWLPICRISVLIWNSGFPLPVRVQVEPM